MKKLLLSLLAAGAVFTMAAQVPSTSPEPGTVNTSNDQGSNYAPGGLGTFTIYGSNVKVNREGIGYAVLKYNGEIVAQVAPSNMRRAVAVDGFDKGDITGSEIQILFFDGSNADNPYRRNGEYQVIIPSGFYTANGVENTVFQMNFTITDAAAATKYYTVSADPAAGSVQTLSSVTLTFNGLNGATVTGLKINEDSYNFTSPYEGETVTTTEDDVVITEWKPETIIPSYSINGNQITFTLPEPFEVKADHKSTLTIEDDAITVITDLAEQKYEGTFIYSITGKTEVETGDLTITPQPGTFEGGLPCFDFTDNASSFSYGKTNAYGIFAVQLPEGATVKGVTGLMMASKAYLADANGTKVSTTTYANLGYQKGKDNSVIYFTNNTYINGSAAWGMDMPMALNPGSYYFVIPAGAFTYDLDGATFSSPEINIGPYVIEAPKTLPEYTLNPADGAELTGLNEITVTFAEDAVINFNVYNRWATLKNGTILIDLEGAVEGNVVKFTSPTVIDTPGTYTLEIAGADLKVNNVQCPISATYTIVPSNLKSITFDQDGTLKDAKKVTDEYGDFYFEAELDIVKGEEMAVQLLIPTGYDSIYYVDTNAGIGGDGPELMVATRSIPVEGLMGEGWKLAEDGKIPVKYGINSLGIAYANGDEATEYSLLLLTVNEVEPPVVEPEYAPLKGTFQATVSQSMPEGETTITTEYPYTIDYVITYNENKTLTVDATYTWADGEPIGLVDGSLLNVTKNIFTDFTPVTRANNELTATTTTTFEPNEVVEFQFYRPMANGIASYNFKIQIPENTVTGVVAIEAEGEAVYYNVNGVRVANPENGLYIKVVNGKASKVVVK